jgi:AraC family transcriptional activator of tynA and feaB
MPTVFSTENMAGQDSLDGYRRAIASHIAHMDVRLSSPHGFDCTIAEHNVGVLQILDIRSDPVLIQRSLECISADQRFQYLIGLSLSGRTSIRHPGGTLEVGPNTLFLLDKALPYESVFHDPAERILVCVRRPHLERRLSDPARYLHTPVSAAAGVCRMASDYLKLLLAEAGQMSAGHQAQAAEICLDLLAMALDAGQEEPRGTVSAERSSGAMLLSRVKAFVRCHLSDSDLSPTSIAGHHGISKRYLHSLFARTGTTLGGWIRQERLGRAHALLTDRRADHLSVTEVALRQGFNDIPHFTRQFKAKYGQSPTCVRRQRPAPEAVT